MFPGFHPPRYGIPALLFTRQTTCISDLRSLNAASLSKFHTLTAVFGTENVTTVDLPFCPSNSCYCQVCWKDFRSKAQLGNCRYTGLLVLLRLLAAWWRHLGDSTNRSEQSSCCRSCRPKESLNFLSWSSAIGKLQCASCVRSYNICTPVQRQEGSGLTRHS